MSPIRYDDQGRFTGSGRLVFRWYPGFDRCSYTDNRLVSCDYAAGGGHETYRYDGKDRLVGATTRTTYRYDAHHRLAEWSREDGSLVAAEYDARGRFAKSSPIHLPGLYDARVRQIDSESPVYRYDAKGRVTDDDHGRHYEWDDRGRLVREHGSKVDTTWDYDCADAR